ncbi:hypothetical protein PG987_004725 [Apiospora arundinis]
MGALTVAAVHYRNDIVRIANQTHNDIRDYLNQPARQRQLRHWARRTPVPSRWDAVRDAVRDLVPVDLRNPFVGRGAT